MLLFELKLASKDQRNLFAECYNFEPFEEYTEVTEPECQVGFLRENPFKIGEIHENTRTY